MVPLAPVIGPHPGPGWRISMQRGGRTGAAAYRGARPGDGPAAAADRRPTQSGAALRRNGPELKVLGDTAGTGGGNSEP